MRCKILGKFWTLKFIRRPFENNDGSCDAPDVKGKSICIKKSLRGERRLEILIHEMLHAADWHRSEEFVSTVSQDIARTLTRLGYKSDK